MDHEQTGAGVAEPPAEQNVAQGTATQRSHREERGAAGQTNADRGRAGEGGSSGAAVVQGPPRGVVREYFESLVVTAIMALFGMTFVVQAVKVPTGSMQNTIFIGDHLLVNKFIFAPGRDNTLPFLPQRGIRRGDIIVFKYPGKYQSPQFQRPEVDDTLPNNLPFKTNYVKRVIGLPGERVELRGAQVLINGQPLEERLIAAQNPPPEDDPRIPGNESDAPLTILDSPAASGEGDYDAYWSPGTLAATRRIVKGEVFDVPADYYFVMGDNRENSQDSRYWGYVHRDLVIGRALFVYWSYDESAPTSGNPLIDFFNNTRWGRTGTLVK
jgi:signal peptidase I